MNKDRNSEPDDNTTMRYPNTLGLSHWDPYAMHRGGEWSWWDSSLIWKTNWFPSVLWHNQSNPTQHEENTKGSL